MPPADECEEIKVQKAIELLRNNPGITKAATSSFPDSQLWASTFQNSAGLIAHLFTHPPTHDDLSPTPFINILYYSSPLYINI